MTPEASPLPTIFATSLEALVVMITAGLVLPT
jgi:hypothetical protein